ncbi:hypothetical protein BaRGS_00038422 [Batillaria attramentaria]|uniref:Cubilin n=1 Tax=Batillaria attramentaria TaxID=370345 RepID=A0ABD0J6G0_9CAEN
MRRILLHFLFLWLRAHWISFLPVCYAKGSVEVLCGNVTGLERTNETQSVHAAGITIHLRHPEMIDGVADLVAGMHYEVTFTSDSDVTQVEGVAIIRTTQGEQPVTADFTWPQHEHRCRIQSPTPSLPSDTPSRPSTTAVTPVFVIVVNASAWLEKSEELCQPTGCKQYFTSETGVVLSPGFPNTYPDGSNCTYVIVTPPFTTIHLQFQAFDLEDPYETKCVDWLSVANSTADNSSALVCGKYDVSQLRHLHYVSASNAMVIRFLSDDKDSCHGFKAVYATTRKTECDRLLTVLNGTITSPRLPATGTYLPNMLCNTTISLPSSYRIRFYPHRLNFSDVHTGACAQGDFLDFRDLGYDNSQRFSCTSEISKERVPMFESSGSRVEVMFTSDHVIQGEGFQVFYMGVPSCRNETYNVSSGSVASVNHPRNYPNNQECFYTINVDDQDDVIELTFQKFMTESDRTHDAMLRDRACTRDFVEVFDGKDRHKVCGDWSGKEHLLLFRSRSNVLVFRFVSDEQETRPGFYATWQTVRGDNKSCLSTWIDNGQLCFQSWEDGEADCISRGGHLATILDSATQSMLNDHILTQECTDAEAFWIGASDRDWESDFYWPDGTKVSFTNWFPGFPLSGARGRVWGRQPSDDGQAGEDCVEMRRRFARPEKGHTVMPNFLWNDRDCQRRNPYICQTKPQLIPPEPVKCDQNISLTTDQPWAHVHSVGYPSNYPDHTNCSYFIHAPPTARIEIEFFDFHLENESDSDCGNNSLAQTSSGCLKVMSGHDGAVMADTLCEQLSASLWAPEARAEIPVVMSRLLAEIGALYAGNTSIVVQDTTAAEEGYTCLVVKVTDSVVMDNVTAVTRIMTSPTDCRSPLPVVCHQTNPDLITPASPDVHFLNDSTGRLQPRLGNDNYSYTNDDATTWVLQAPPQHRVLVVLENVEVELQDECLYDWIVLNNTTRTSRICGQVEGSVAALSLENLAQASFHSDYSVTGKAFTLSWQALNMTECRSNLLEGPSGNFSSFNFPYPFPDVMDCVIEITVNENSRVAVVFQEVTFYSGGSESVTMDFGDGVTSVLTDFNVRGLLARRFVSHGHVMKLRLSRDSLQAGEGFRGYYEEVPARYELPSQTAVLQPNTSSTATLFSPNFPSPYPKLVVQETTVRVPIGYRIDVTFLHFRLAESAGCDDVLDIDDVSLGTDDVRAIQLKKLCGGSGQPNDTSSNLNMLRIRFVANSTRTTVRQKRAVVAEDEASLGFSVYFTAVADPDYLTKTANITDGTFDSCSEQPCVNGSTCLQTDNNRARCKCLPSFTGLFCQTQWCDLDPCGAHGQCDLQDTVPGFQCTCDLGHWGVRCQMDEAACRKEVCHGRGACAGNSSSPQCVCDNPDTGMFCNVTTVGEYTGESIGQRLLREPILIGLIVILSVLLLFGILCIVRRRCAKRFACCRIQFKRKEPTANGRQQDKRSPNENAPYGIPLNTFNVRRHLLRPPAMQTPVTSRATPAMPTISITKPEDDTVSLPKTPDQLKAEVAARFFASYREAERSPISNPLPTDFSKTTDTFLTQHSEDASVGAIVGGTLLIDLNHRKGRDDRLSRSSSSIGTRRSRSLSPNGERIKRCNSTGHYLPRQDKHVEGHWSPTSSLKSRSLDDREVFLDPESGGLTPDADFHKELHSDDMHLFPEVIVKSLENLHHEDDTSDASRGGSPITTRALQQSLALILLQQKNDVDTGSLRNIASHTGSASLHHAHSDNSLRLVRPDELHENRLGYTRSERHWKMHEEDGGTTRAHRVNLLHSSENRHAAVLKWRDSKDRITFDAGYLRDSGGVEREHDQERGSRGQRRKLIHQETVDSYLRHSRSQDARHKHAPSHAEPLRHSRTEGSLRDEYESPSRVSHSRSEQFRERANSHGKESVSRERRARFRRNETIQAESFHHNKHHTSRRSHKLDRNMRKWSSLDLMDAPSDSVPARAKSQEYLDGCQCSDCFSETSHSHSSKRRHKKVHGSSHKHGNREKGRSSRDKSSRERKRLGHSQDSPRRRGRRSPSGPPRLARSCGSLSSRNDHDLLRAKTSESSESEPVHGRPARRERDKRASSVGDNLRHRGIDALGSSSSDKDFDLSRKELFMKFFSQEVDLDDTYSSEEPRFFLGSNPGSMDSSVYSRENSLKVAQGKTHDPYLRENSLKHAHARTHDVIRSQKHLSRLVRDRSSGSSRADSLQLVQERIEPSAFSPESVHSKVQSRRDEVMQENSFKPVEDTADDADTCVVDTSHVTLQPGPAVNSLRVSQNEHVMRSERRPPQNEHVMRSERRPPQNVLTSTCSVIVYDDDLRTVTNTHSLSVSPKRTSVSTAGASDHEMDAGISREDRERRSTVATADLDSSGSAESVPCKPSRPSSLLSVTDTDSAVSSAASRQTTPVNDAVYTSSGSRARESRAVSRVKDSAYQTKESSMDNIVFEPSRDKGRRKSLPSVKAEDRKVTQRLHQAAVKLYILQQRVRKARLSRDSAVNTISEDEAWPDSDEISPSGYHPRYSWLARKPGTCPELHVGGDEDTRPHGIREEEEHESDLEVPRGLNPTPETLPSRTDHIVEEQYEPRECEA